MAQWMRCLSQKCTKMTSDPRTHIKLHRSAQPRMWGRRQETPGSWESRLAWCMRWYWGLVSGRLRTCSKIKSVLPDTMAHACNPRTWGTLKTGSSVWGQLWLHPEFQASLGATTVPTPAEPCTWQSEQGTQQTYREQKESRAVWTDSIQVTRQSAHLKTQVPSVSYAWKIQSAHVLLRNLRFQQTRG